MFDRTWRQAYDEWGAGESEADEEAFAQGWSACLAQIIALLDDERRQGARDA